MALHDVPRRDPLPLGRSVESRGFVTAADQELLARFGACVRELGRIDRRLPAALHVMRDSLGGQPKAAASHREGDDAGDEDADRRRLWCEEHEQSLDRCDPTGPCEGLRDREISDPTGTAAVAFDPAASDMATVRKRLDGIVRQAVELAALLAAYPTDVQVREQLGPDDEIGTVWCRCCWKDDKYCEPITTRSSGPKAGSPYYVGLCRWCGQMKAELGFEPPTWMVAMRHRGERIGPGHVEKALEQRPATPKKSKGRGKRK
jgi:hypothetical protein